MIELDITLAKLLCCIGDQLPDKAFPLRLTCHQGESQDSLDIVFAVSVLPLSMLLRTHSRHAARLVG